MSAVVETSRGVVLGREEAGLRVFRGLPYARPPVGARRFLPPEAAGPWAGVREATAFGPSAYQNANSLGPLLGFDIGPMSEDCLTVNVWTPACDGGRRPVLVWIHGGGFVIGAGSQPIYDGATLARRGDVVVVTINYRLGALGFLHLRSLCGDRMPASGNEGILDQIAALRWVRDEIAAFGGDPGNVTVFGESAGSISVATLMGTPAARGLFRRAILQSGSANFVAPLADGVGVSEAFLRELGIAPAEAERLRDVPPARLLEAQQRLVNGGSAARLGLPFVPLVDGEVIPRHPFDAIRDGHAADVTTLVGTTLEEMRLFTIADAQVRGLDEAALVRRCERNAPGSGARAVETYRAARAARGQSTAPPDLWVAIETDRAFRHPAMRLAELQRTHQPATHAYLFTWCSPLLDGALGACHALELPFVFGTLTDSALAKFAGGGPEAAALAEHVQDAWIAFVRSGDPGHAGVGGWPAYDTRRRATMLLGRECGVVDAPYEDERRFWDSIRA